MKFVSYDIRPCIEYKTGHDDHVESFASEDDYKTALAAAEASGDTYETFWTVYGLYDDGDGCLLSMAIGDFTTKKDAEEILNAIIPAPVTVPPATIYRVLREFRKKGAFQWEYVTVMCREIAEAANRCIHIQHHHQ